MWAQIQAPKLPLCLSMRRTTAKNSSYLPFFKDFTLMARTVARNQEAISLSPNKFAISVT